MEQLNRYGGSAHRLGTCQTGLVETTLLAMWIIAATWAMALTSLTIFVIGMLIYNLTASYLPLNSYVTAARDKLSGNEPLRWFRALQHRCCPWTMVESLAGERYGLRTIYLIAGCNFRYLIDNSLLFINPNRLKCKTRKK
jgi:hypothetical protein